jgi:hypothetical protein
MMTQITLAPDVAQRLDQRVAVSGQAAEELVNAILRRELERTGENAPSGADPQAQSSGTLAELFAGRVGRVQGLPEPAARNASERYAKLLEEEYRHREPRS